MINLLPLEQKNQIRAGRTNVILLRYNILVAVAAGFLGLACTGVLVFLNLTNTSADTTINDNSTKASGYAEVEQQAAAYKRNLSVAKQILNKEVAYSSIMIAISQAIPKGVILDNLQLDAKSFGTPITLNARAKTPADAVSLKNSLSASPVVSSVSLQTVVSTDAQTGIEAAYPYTVSASVTLKKDAK